MTEKRLTFTLEFNANVVRTQQGGIIDFITDRVEVRAKKKSKEKSREQQNLLRGIERLIFFAENGREPLSQEINNIHEALLELYAPRKPSPIGDGKIIIRTGDPDLTTKGMAKIIWGAWNELCLLDIPKELSDTIETDLKHVWDAVKKWKTDTYYETIREIESSMSFEEYKITHPICEFTGKHGTIEDPLERVHLISKGASPEFYEEPWNYVMGLHSIHRRIHDNGWQGVLNDYPHLRRKYKDAFTKLRRESSSAERTKVPSGQ